MDEAKTSKVFYRPIEAAIRWADLLQYEPMILASMSSRRPPQSLDCPRWNECRLYWERIYDGILNKELPFGKNGITRNDDALLNSPDLTIRHVDLKRWITTHYPNHLPKFLFSDVERMARSFAVEAGQTILMDHMALKAALKDCQSQYLELRQRYDALLRQSTIIFAAEQCAISNRSETTYLHIIGGMLALMLGQSPSGAPYSSFRTQEAIVSALLAHYGGIMGITERTLHGKFANAKRSVPNISSVVS